MLSLASLETKSYISLYLRSFQRLRKRSAVSAGVFGGACSLEPEPPHAAASRARMASGARMRRISVDKNSSSDGQSLPAIRTTPGRSGFRGRTNDYQEEARPRTRSNKCPQPRD